MLRKMLSLLAVLVAFVAAPTWAQTSQSVSRSMSLTIVPYLTCTGDRDIDFGTHTIRDGPLFTSATNYAQWTCQTDPGNRVSVTFTLPSTMTNPQATGLPVPLSYGNQSGFIDANGTQFDPSTGITNDIVTSGTAVIKLGYPQNNLGQTELVRADIANASTQGGGHYSATVTVNVVLN